MYSFPVTALTNDHKLRGLKQYKFMILHFRRSEFQNGSHQGCSFRRLWGESVSLSSLASRGHLHPLPVDPSSSKPESFSLSLTLIFDLPLPSFKDPVMSSGPHGSSRIISRLKPLNLLTPAKSLLPCQVTYPQVLGIRTWTSLGTTTLPTQGGVLGKDQKGRGHKMATSEMTPTTGHALFLSPRAVLSLQHVLLNFSAQLLPRPIMTSQTWHMRNTARRPTTHPDRVPTEKHGQPCSQSHSAPGPASPRRLAVVLSLTSPGVIWCQITIKESFKKIKYKPTPHREELASENTGQRNPIPAPPGP